MNSFSIPLPLSNPVLIFSLILFIILFAPILLNKLKIPHLIGLIIAGALIGPNGLNIMKRDSSIILFGTVGLLYIMFLAGLEIDIADFKRNSKKSIVFGLLTFSIPMLLGTFAGIYILHFSVISSVLLASMFASHTLIAYPIVSKLGITKNRAVSVAIGGTVITDTAALLILSVIAGISSGVTDNFFWLRLTFSIFFFGGLILLVFPIIGRWFFKRYDDSISQYIFVLGMVFLGGFIAETAGTEAIIGAFLAGFSLNRLIPRTSPLMNRIEFVGNSLFIPIFLLGVGMLINSSAFVKDLYTIKVALVMVVVAIVAKYLAALATQRIFKFSIDERRIIFGLSNAQAAATLAAVLVGYNIILNKGDIEEAATLGLVLPPNRLLDEAVLNGSILMILVTCTIASMVTQKGAQNIALAETTYTGTEPKESNERILIALTNPETTEELVNLSMVVKASSNKSGLYGLHVVEHLERTDSNEKLAKKLLEKAASTAAGADLFMHELLRYDYSFTNGLAAAVKENKVSDILLGIQSDKGISSNFTRNLNETLLPKCSTTTLLIYKNVQPIATVKRHVVVVPERAEKEIGFPFWISKIWNIEKNTGDKLIFYSSGQTLEFIKEIWSKSSNNPEFIDFSDWNEFLIIGRELKPDDNLVVVMSRKDKPSYQSNMANLHKYLNKYFAVNNFILIYPIQTSLGEISISELNNPTLVDAMSGIDDIGKTIARLFSK